MTEQLQMYIVEVDGLVISFNIIACGAGSGQEAYREVSIVSAMIVDLTAFETIYGDDESIEFANDPVDWAWERLVMDDAGAWLMAQVGQ